MTSARWHQSPSASAQEMHRDLSSQCQPLAAKYAASNAANCGSGAHRQPLLPSFVGTAGRPARVGRACCYRVPGPGTRPLSRRSRPKDDSEPGAGVRVRVTSQPALVVQWLWCYQGRLGSRYSRPWPSPSHESGDFQLTLVTARRAGRALVSRAGPAQTSQEDPAIKRQKNDTMTTMA